jgi:hypothetical protein
MPALGHYRTLIPKEAPTFKYSLTSSSEASLLVNIREQGIPKQFIQPGRISISAPAGLINADSIPHWIQVSIKGFSNAKTILSSRNSAFSQEDGIFPTEFQPNEAINLLIDLQIPYFTTLTNADVSEGAIVFTDYKSGENLGEIPVRIINVFAGTCVLRQALCCRSFPRIFKQAYP